MDVDEFSDLQDLVDMSKRAAEMGDSSRETTLATFLCALRNFFEIKGIDVAAVAQETDLQIRMLKERHRQELEDVELRHREDVRYEVCSAADKSRQVASHAAVKQIHMLRGENVILKKDLDRTTEEKVTLEKEAETLKKSLEDANDSIAVLEQSFAAVQKVAQQLKEDAALNVCSATQAASREISGFAQRFAAEAAKVGLYASQVSGTREQSARELDRQRNEHNILVQQLEKEIESLRGELGQRDAAYLELLTTYRDATTRQTTVLGKLAKNNLELMEQRHEKRTMTIDLRPRSADHSATTTPVEPQPVLVDELRKCYSRAQKWRERLARREKAHQDTVCLAVPASPRIFLRQAGPSR